jgi:hypothetical protein
MDDSSAAFMDGARADSKSCTLAEYSAEAVRLRHGGRIRQHAARGVFHAVAEHDLDELLPEHPCGATGGAAFKAAIWPLNSFMYSRSKALPRLSLLGEELIQRADGSARELRCRSSASPHTLWSHGLLRAASRSFAARLRRRL